MLKVVVDTNVFISGLLKNAACRKIINHLKASKFQLVISPQTLDELIGVMARPKFHAFITQETATRLIETIKTQAIIVSPRHKLSVIREDPDDNRFLEAALEARADIIVSGDNHILGCKSKFDIPILTPTEFLKRLEE